MATTSRLKLTRDQLASFLKDPEQIRQFERLFATASELKPTTLGDIALSLATAEIKASEALDGIESLRRDTATTDALTQAQVAQVQAQLAALAQQLEDGRIAQTAALLDALRLQVEGLQIAPPPREFARARYGSFYDTTTQAAAAINTATTITFNTTDLSRGVHIGTTTSRVYVDTPGIYNFQTSIQLDSTVATAEAFYLWFRINGVDVTNSASQLRIQGNNAEVFVALNYFFNLKADDYVELVYSVSNLGVQLLASGAVAPHPGIPSVILTVANNIEGVK
jgi:hypothetical protein